MADEMDEPIDLQGGEEEEEDESDEDEELDWVGEEEEEEQLEDHELSPPSEDAFEMDMPAERSGHIAVIDENYIFVWGGYKNTQTTGFFDFYLPRNEIWIYNTETGRWKKRMTEGDVPPSMSGSCAVCVEGVLYLFGGHHSRETPIGAPAILPQFYRLPLRTPGALRWEKMRDLKGLCPSAKDKLGCWVHKNRLVFFGGYGYAAVGGHLGTFEYDETSFWANGAGRGWNNHIHVLDLETFVWTQPVIKEYRLNDLYYINMDTWEWNEMSVPQYGPVGRSWHSFIPVSPDHIFLFGGFTTDKQTLSDAWLYCVSKNEWKPFKHRNTENPRLWHTACAGPEGEVFVFGGCANNLLSHQRAAHSNEILVFSVQPKSLSRFCMEAVMQHREQLAGSWDSLPKHLLQSLAQRLDGINTLGS